MTIQEFKKAAAAAKRKLDIYLSDVERVDKALERRGVALDIEQISFRLEFIKDSYQEYEATMSSLISKLEG